LITAQNQLALENAAAAEAVSTTDLTELDKLSTSSTIKSEKKVSKPLTPQAVPVQDNLMEHSEFRPGDKVMSKLYKKHANTQFPGDLQNAER